MLLPPTFSPATEVTLTTAPPPARRIAGATALVVTRWWGHASAEQLHQMRASFPLQRSIEPEEVATAAMELIRNEAMTGQTLAQDAGLLLL